MKYHWLRDKELQKLIYVFWDKGIHNDADYFYQTSFTSHHQNICNKYILKGYNMGKICSNLSNLSMREGVL